MAARPNARQAYCIRGHAQTPANRYKDKWCRPCRTERARAYRADGRMPELRGPERYHREAEERKRRGRDFYYANKTRYQKQRIIWRLRKRENLSDNEILYLRELISEVARMPLKSPDKSLGGHDRRTPPRNSQRVFVHASSQGQEGITQKVMGA